MDLINNFPHERTSNAQIKMFITTTIFDICHSPWQNNVSKDISNARGLKILLDSGSTASIITKNMASYGKTRSGKNTKKRWDTAAGTFSTDHETTMVLILPEL